MATKLGRRCAVAVPVPSSGEVIALIEFFGTDATQILNQLAHGRVSYGNNLGIHNGLLQTGLNQRIANVVHIHKIMHVLIVIYCSPGRP